MKIINFLLFALVTIVLQSCKSEDTYHDLSMDAKSFINFEKGHVFKLKNIVSNEIITLKVSSKDFVYENIGSGESSMASFGSAPGENYAQKGTIYFKDNNQCYKGNIVVQATENGDYSILFILNGCFSTNGWVYYLDNPSPLSINVNGIVYPKVYKFVANNNIMYFSKEKGIIQISEIATNNVLFSIVE